MKDPCLSPWIAHCLSNLAAALRYVDQWSDSIQGSFIYDLVKGAMLFLLMCMSCLIAGCKNIEHGQILKELMQTPNFRITVVQEADTVEICGALKVWELHCGLLPGKVL